MSDTPSPAALAEILYSAVDEDFDLAEVKAALAAGADPNLPLEGRYALVSAAGLGGFKDHTAIANLLMKKGADPNVQNPDGDTALCVAAREGLLKMAKLLLKNGADVHATSTIEQSWFPPESGGRTPLFYAALIDHDKLAKVLIEAGADVNAATDTTPLAETTEKTRALGMTPLMAAARHGSEGLRIAKLLVQHGAELDHRDAMGETALMFAARCDENGQTVRHLIKSGAALDLRSNDGKRAIGIAAENGNATATRTLANAGAACEPDEALAVAILEGEAGDVQKALDAGADPSRYGLLGMAIKQELETALVETLLAAGSPVNARSQGMTPLMRAAWAERGDVVALLLAHGADIDAGEEGVHDPGRTALICAVQGEDMEIPRTLLEHGASPDLGRKSGMPPIYYASEAGNAALIRLLLEHGASVNIDAAEGSFQSRCNPLHAAAGKGDPDIVDLLLDSGARPDFRIDKGETALHRAAEKGSWQAVDRLLAADAPIEARCDKGKTPLIRACEARPHRVVRRDGELVVTTRPFKTSRTYIVNALLIAGADIHARDGEGRTALWYGAYSPELAVLLVGLGADPNAHDQKGVSVLARAAQGCSMEEGAAALYLLTQGADPRFREGRMQWTPLMWTGMYGCVRLAEALIAGGADIQVVLSDGTSARSVAAHYRRSDELVALLDRLGADPGPEADTPLHVAARDGDAERVAKLLADGCDVEDSDDDGCTGLFFAAHWGHTALVKTLLDAGALVDARNGMTGWTPLRAAAGRGHLAVIQRLLAAGADVHVRDDEEETPLFGAARTGHAGAVEALLARGATADVVANEGWTPMLEAAAGGSPVIVEALRASGAEMSARTAAGWGLFRIALEHDTWHLFPLFRTHDVPAEPAECLLAAAAEGDVGALEQALKDGADVSARLSDGRTALSLAATRGHIAAVEALLAHGCPADAKAGTDEDSAMDFAIRGGHSALFGILSEAGATARTRSLVVLGAQHMVDEDWAGARAVYGRIGPDERSVDTWVYLGTCAQQLGDPEGVVEAAAQADALDPLTPPSVQRLNQLAYAYWQLKRWEDMLRTALRATEVGPEDTYAWQQLGLAHQELGDWSAAKTANEKAIELHRFNGYAHCNLGWVIWLSEGRVELECFEEAFRWAPDLRDTSEYEADPRYRGILDDPGFTALLEAKP